MFTVLIFFTSSQSCSIMFHSCTSAFAFLWDVFYCRCAPCGQCEWKNKNCKMKSIPSLLPGLNWPQEWLNVRVSYVSKQVLDFRALWPMGSLLKEIWHTCTQAHHSLEKRLCRNGIIDCYHPCYLGHCGKGIKCSIYIIGKFFFYSSALVQCMNGVTGFKIILKRAFYTYSV